MFPSPPIASLLGQSLKIRSLPSIPGPFNVIDLVAVFYPQIVEILHVDGLSSWGDFVYQGKVVLYHSLTLLLGGRFEARSVSDFQVQLATSGVVSLRIAACSSASASV